MPPRGRGLAHPAPTRTFCGPAQLSSSNNKMLLCQASELCQLPARSKSQPELGTVSTAAPVRQPRGAGAGPVPCVPRARNHVRAQGETQQRDPMCWEMGTKSAREGQSGAELLEAGGTGRTLQPGTHPPMHRSN